MNNLKVYRKKVDYKLLDDAFSKDRPWSKRNSPKSAIEKFLKTNETFEIDHSVDDRLLLSMAPGGFLKKIN